MQSIARRLATATTTGGTQGIFGRRMLTTITNHPSGVAVLTLNNPDKLNAMTEVGAVLHQPPAANPETRPTRNQLQARFAAASCELRRRRPLCRSGDPHLNYCTHAC